MPQAEDLRPEGFEAVQRGHVFPVAGEKDRKEPASGIMETETVGCQQGLLLGNEDRQVSRGMSPDFKETERHASEIQFLAVFADQSILKVRHLLHRGAADGISLRREVCRHVAVFSHNRLRRPRMGEKRRGALPREDPDAGISLAEETDTRQVIAVGMGNHDEIRGHSQPVKPADDLIGRGGDPRFDQRGETIATDEVDGERPVSQNSDAPGKLLRKRAAIFLISAIHSRRPVWTGWSNSANFIRSPG